MRFIYAIAPALLLLLAACSQPATTNGPAALPSSSNLVGLTDLITLQPDTTLIHLEDYFMDVSKVDSVDVGEAYTALLSANKKAVRVVRTGNAPAYSQLGIWSAGHRWVLPLRKARKQTVTLTYNANGTHPGEVQMAGDFNGWTPARTPFTHNGTVWETALPLNPGRYQYQLVVDGQWMLDPANADSVSNNNGGFNSLLVVGDAPNNKRPMLFPRSEDSTGIFIEAVNGASGYMAFWNNYLLDTAHVTATEAGLTISLPAEAAAEAHSTLRVFGWNEAGAANDLRVPLAQGKVVRTPAQLAATDKHRKSIYFMMVDRFHNGNTANDEPIDDPEVLPMANYHGGDLAGIQQKIDEGFFTDLGFNTVWLSPITQNPRTAFIEWPEPHRKFSGYHGYWPISLTRIDHRFGTPDELHGLVDAAHAKDMGVILDFVSNHVHQEWPLYQQNKDWGTMLDLPDGRKNIRIWDEHRLTTWFDTFLPSLDHSRPEVRELLADSAMYWLTEYNLDGFRHDATKHIPQEFWRLLTRKLKQNVVSKGEPVFQIGETFGSRELIGDYVGNGQMDGQFDFNLYFDARNAFVSSENSTEPLAASLQESLDYYGYHHLMGNITGNHDMPRFISYAGDGLSFSEDPKEAGWSRDIQVENPEGYQKLQALTTFIMTIPGVPVVYYGDEFGMPGAGDPDNRRDMKFSGYTDEEAATRDHVKWLNELRNNNMVLLYGVIHNIGSTNNGACLYYERSYMDQHMLVMINTSNRPQNCVVQTDYHTRGGSRGLKGYGGVSDSNVKTCDLPPYGIEIFLYPRP